MAAAAAEQAFERAALVRDKLEMLVWLHEQLETLRQARMSPAFVYPGLGFDGSTIWYLIHGGRAIVGTPAARPHGVEQDGSADATGVSTGRR